MIGTKYSLAKGLGTQYRDVSENEVFHFVVLSVRGSRAVKSRRVVSQSVWCRANPTPRQNEPQGEVPDPKGKRICSCPNSPTPRHPLGSLDRSLQGKRRSNEITWHARRCVRKRVRAARGYGGPRECKSGVPLFRINLLYPPSFVNQSGCPREQVWALPSPPVF